jgi:HEAT repeat protein
MNDIKLATVPQLIDHIKSGDPQRIVEAARECASRHEASATPYLLETLQGTHDAAVRNAVALALSDLKSPSAFSVLVDLLRSDRTRGSQGTLLYALGAYDCSSILPLLVDLVIEGNFEVSRQAFSLISGIETELDERAWKSCSERLRSALKVATEERRLLLEELVSLFEEDE